jgi:hypothetical protein
MMHDGKPQTRRPEDSQNLKEECRAPYRLCSTFKLRTAHCSFSPSESFPLLLLLFGPSIGRFRGAFK